MKRAVIILFAIIFSFGSRSSVRAGNIDLGKWNNEGTLYIVQTTDTHSNSGVIMAFLRTDFDHPSNRVRLLFSLELDSFNEENKSGVCLRVNGGENIILYADGTAEYNEDDYFAQVVSDADPRTRTLYLEVTLAIKQGIPENFILDFNFYDTSGVTSNTYSIDISDVHVLPSADNSEEPSTKHTKKTASQPKREPSKTKTTTKTSNEASTDGKIPDSATQPHELDGQVISVNRTDRAVAIITGLTVVTLLLAGAYYLIQRKNDSRFGG